MRGAGDVLCKGSTADMRGVCVFAFFPRDLGNECDGDGGRTNGRDFGESEMRLGEQDHALRMKLVWGVE